MVASSHATAGLRRREPDLVAGTVFRFGTRWTRAGGYWPEGRRSGSPAANYSADTKTGSAAWGWAA